MGVRYFTALFVFYSERVFVKKLACLLLMFFVFFPSLHADWHVLTRSRIAQVLKKVRSPLANFNEKFQKGVVVITTLSLLCGGLTSCQRMEYDRDGNDDMMWETHGWDETYYEGDYVVSNPAVPVDLHGNAISDVEWNQHAANDSYAVHDYIVFLDNHGMKRDGIVLNTDFNSVYVRDLLNGNQEWIGKGAIVRKKVANQQAANDSYAVNDYIVFLDNHGMKRDGIVMKTNFNSVYVRDLLNGNQEWIGKGAIVRKKVANQQAANDSYAVNDYIVFLDNHGMKRDGIVLKTNFNSVYVRDLLNGNQEWIGKGAIVRKKVANQQAANDSYVVHDYIVFLDNHGMKRDGIVLNTDFNSVYVRDLLNGNQEWIGKGAIVRKKVANQQAANDSYAVNDYIVFLDNHGMKRDGIVLNTDFNSVYVRDLLNGNQEWIGKGAIVKKGRK